MLCDPTPSECKFCGLHKGAGLGEELGLIGFMWDCNGS